MLGRLPATLELCALALLIAVASAVTLAFVATRWRETPAETGVDVVSGIALSVPDFLWGLALILLFGVAVPIFEISGRVTPQPRPAVRHAVLPAREHPAPALRSYRDLLAQ